MLRLVLGTAALAAIAFLGAAQPAAADNCSGLSDCYFVSKSAVTVTVGIGTVAVVLLLVPPVGGSPDVKPLNPSDVPVKPQPGKTGLGPPDPKLPEPGLAGKTALPGGRTGIHRPPDHVKVAGPDGAVVDRPVKPPRPAPEDAAIHTKVRDAERAVAKLPRPRQKVIFEEEALAAGRGQHIKTLAAALRRGAPPEEWLRIVNPTGDRANVVAAVNATDAVLAKVPRVAKTGGALSTDALAAAHDSIVTQISDLHEIGHFLAKAGPGARGVVTVHMTLPVSWANAAPVDVGHAFNAANIDGRIVFLDPQTAATALTPHDLLSAAGHDLGAITSVQFVPTHPLFS